MNRRHAAFALLAVLALSGCAAHPTAAATRTVHGTLDLAQGAYEVAAGNTDVDGNVAPGVPCDPTGDYVDLKGSEVDVLSASGKVLGLGSLAGGKMQDDNATCSLRFTVGGVPTGEAIYSVKLGRGGRPVTHLHAAELWAGPVLTLG